MIKVGITKEEYAENQANKQRQEGTKISKDAMRLFIKGIDIRMKSGAEFISETYHKSQRDKYAALAFFFFKYLTDEISFDEKNTLKNTPILTLWVRDDGEPQMMWNLMDDGAVGKSIKKGFIPLVAWAKEFMERIVKYEEQDNAKES